MDDWELLHGSDTESTDSITMSSSVFDDGMIILSDHFSADDNNPTDLNRCGAIESGDASRVYEGSEPLNQVEGLVDLGFDDDQLNVNQSGDGFASNEIGIYDSTMSGTFGDGGEVIRLSDFESANESEAVVESTDGNVSHYEDASKCLSKAEDLEVAALDSSKSCSDLEGNEMGSGDSGVVNEGSDGNTLEVVASASSGGEGRSKEIVWWKMPFVLLKYSVFRIGPVWSVSMAAAVMGLVLLGRRLYNIKKKAQRFHLKVTIDDKKVSRVMSQAARLNAAFTEVRRVPVIRPALPSPVAWPVLSLR